MKPRTLVIFGILGVGVAIFAILQAKKAQAMRLFEKIMFSLSGLGDVGMANGGIWLKLHFALTNPTAEDFYVNTNGAIQVKNVPLWRADRIRYHSRILPIRHQSGTDSNSQRCSHRDKPYILRN